MSSNGRLLWKLDRKTFVSEHISIVNHNKSIFRIAPSKKDEVNYDLYLNGQFVVSNSIGEVMRYAENML